MCPPKPPKIETTAPPAPPPAPVTPQTPELAFNEEVSPAARRRMGKNSLRTDKAGSSTSVKLPRMKILL